jgi:hypothetical protein
VGFQKSVSAIVLCCAKPQIVSLALKIYILNAKITTKERYFRNQDWIPESGGDDAASDKS